ncbi:hypothetical protein [Amycolatopsis sp. H20-H5]|uniref:hypothetical protein n=1 Tax=Amycolatopsis sp. H20-H5 TaxID=3046309 RepID=UPI002DBDD247|nr:hypothetical protein [Amycolatopsis sp. H20-H5]MEC3980608.1 hypothetical protein [Amycolatopsis sp. H20-H5]
MSVLTRLRTRPGNGPEMGTHTIGNALVVHPKDRMTNGARALAMSVAADPDHDLVVVDLPTGSPISMWESVAEVLPRRRRGVRLVIGGRSRETTALAGQWLSERLGRTVLAPDGNVVPGASGSLFVHSGQGSGWVRFHPGRPPQWEAKRFPRPSWDSAEVAEFWPTSATGVAEPIPGGVWIRPLRHAPEHRNRLIESVPCQPEVLSLVLGCPGAPPLELEDVARFWQKLPPELRERARFVLYGPLVLPPDTSAGQALADALGEKIACYLGMPTGQAAAPEVYTLGPDGRLGWHSYSRELGFEPGGDGPALVSHRRPVYGVAELAPAVYWYAPDAVLEVVQSGLWVRPPHDVDTALAVRMAPLDPAVNVLTYDASTESIAARMRLLAEDVLSRLDQTTRRLSRIVPASALHRPRVRVSRPAAAVVETVETAAVAPVVPVVDEPSQTQVVPAAQIQLAEVIEAPPVEPAGAPIAQAVELPVESPGDGSSLSSLQLRLESSPLPSDGQFSQPVDVPAAPVAEAPAQVAAVAVAEPVVKPDVKPEVKPQATARPQPAPSTEASALLPRGGLDKERGWLRTTLSREYEAIAHTVARVLSEHPGVQGGQSRSSAEVLTDAVAVRLYLSAAGDAIDRGLRTAEPGPHVPFARCVVSGLNRLPSHRGATVFTASPTPAQLKLYRERRLLTEWGFTSALTGPCAGQKGEVDVLLWAMTSRRTRLLEPENDPTEDRVLFVPGTSFKVLDLVEPTEGKRGQILLRELSAAEIGPDGRVENNRGSLDEMAVTSLREHLGRWAEAEPRRRVARSAADRFGALPGLV